MQKMQDFMRNLWGVPARPKLTLWSPYGPVQCAQYSLQKVHLACEAPAPLCSPYLISLTVFPILFIFISYMLCGSVWGGLEQHL